MKLGPNSIRAAWGSLLIVTGAGAAALSYADVIDRPYFKADSIVIVFGADDFQENGGVAPIAYDFLLLDTASGTAGTDLIAADGRAVNFNTGRYNPIQSGDSSGWEYQINNATFGGQFNSNAPHQTLDAGDSYNAFGLDDTTDVDLLGGGARASMFFVASNAPFDIFGEASNIQATGDFASLDYSNIRYRLRTRITGGGSGANRWGQQAQDPAIGGTGILLGAGLGLLGLNTLADLAGGPAKVFDGGQRTAAGRGSIMQQAVGFQSRYNLRGAGITGNNYDFSQGVGTLAADVTYTVYTP